MIGLFHYSKNESLMLRGIKTFVCKDCGHRFKAVDMEWNATAASYPVKCPKCGSMNTK